MSKILITGITGQLGSYLADLCLEKGDEVFGLVRRVATENQDNRYSRIKHILDKITLIPGDIRDYSRMLEIFDKYKFDKCFHMAAQSFVALSFEDNFETMNTNINGTLNILSAIKNKCPNCKFYFSASSEMMGKVEEMPQDEETRFHPRSIYGITKVTGYELTRNFREAHNIFACSGILYNSESPRRGSEFVTRKITKGIADMVNGKTNVLVLGNLEAKRDWSFAGDSVRAMYSMLEQELPIDYVISTGETHSIKEFIELALDYVGIKANLVDLSNVSIEDADRVVERLKTYNECYIVQHPKFYRAAEVDILKGNSRRAHLCLGWKPKSSFEDLVHMMMENDLKNE